MRFWAIYCIQFVIYHLIWFGEANKLLCELYDGNGKSLEKYCDDFKGILPENCSSAVLSESIETSQVVRLRISGCSNDTVFDAIKRFKDVRELDISYSGYKSLKWLNLKLEKLKILNVSHNELSFVPWSLADQTPEIREIDLSFNELTNIDSKHLFDGASELTKIYLSHNALRSISNDAFATLTNLEYIDLSNNRFIKVPVLPKNKHLKTIDLKENPIASFDCFHMRLMNFGVSVLMTWKNVVSFHGNLDCEKNQMRVISNSQEEGVLVTSDGKYELHCSENSFEGLKHAKTGYGSIENAIEILKCFTSTVWQLDLSGNFVGNVNESTFQRFVNLNSLILSDTQLKEFNFNVLQNQYNLTTLDLSKNHLKYLNSTASLESFSRLREVNLAGNGLENVLEVVQHLKPSVERLDLSGNFVGKLNATTFERFTALKALNLSNTSLSIVDNSPFEPLNSLTSLDISRNNMTNANFGVLFTILNKLIEFRAAECQLKNASGVIVLLGPSLGTLDLSGNALEALNAQSLQKFSKLKNVYFSNANLSHFDLAILKNQTELMNLDLSNNQLHVIDLKIIPMSIRHLNFEENELNTIENLNQDHLVHLKTLAISKNQLTCEFLKRINEGMKFQFVGDPFDQKHGENCQFNLSYGIVGAIFFIAILIGAICFGFRKKLFK